jgi:hypothetical protein
MSTIRTSTKPTKLNQRTIPGSPFRFLQPTAKMARTGRIHASFIGRTATLKDAKVKQLI